jgi:hypothetical protein
MKIIKFTAENVKRLKAVEIDPDGTMQVITGRNAQGKSSVLDAIWFALGGGAAARSTSEPVRDGEDFARVVLDLGDLLVTRVWKDGRTTLTVRTADGAKQTSPQTVLDSLVGRLSFDPLEFTRRSDSEQRDALLSLVELPFNPKALDVDRAILFDKRTDVGRSRKALGEIPKVDDDLSEEVTTALDLLPEIRAARASEHFDRDERAKIDQAIDKAKTMTARAAEMIAEAAELHDFAVAKAANLPAFEEGLVAKLEDRLATIEADNTVIRANNAAREVVYGDARLHEEWDELTAEIEALDKRKADGLAAAEFPVDGLGFDDHGVTYRGIPFSQASAAEQIQVSLAMAMNLNPTLRVIRIMDGSLLDADSLAAIHDAAEASDYQVWIERVGDGSDGGVLIEDGQVQ